MALFFKRCFDFLTALILLVLFSPLFLVLPLLILIFMGRPILFTQKRPGYREKPFYILKFRTMRSNAPGEDLPDKDRLTSLGRFMRSFSLDELPQLINVLKGELSLVGPRPLLMEYLPLYNKFEHKRHEVVPGITGWAQINGRNSLNWHEKFALDVWYVENWSLWLDFKILLLTVKYVLIKEGVNSSQDMTMPKFTGSGEKQNND